MGHVYHDVTLTAGHKKKVSMFVDTGATFSVISPELAKELGVKPMPFTHKVQLANGKIVRMKVGQAFFRINKREAANTVLIGNVDEPILGVEALEALGLAVDPNSGTLKETRGYAVRLGGIR